MKFSIITPSYKRSDKISRAVNSVLNQTYSDWEMIIVNDSPDDDQYALFEKTISDQRIIYLKNSENQGVNFSRNRALDNISKNSDWVIFLDDDDYLASDALSNFCNLIVKYPDNKWFATNRTYSNGKQVTSIPKSDSKYSYIIEYLILKRCRGDVTHCISTSLIRDVRFPKKVKQGEEWLFFYQLGLKQQMFYHHHNSTITDGYDEASGLNFRKRTGKEEIKTLFDLAYEGKTSKIIYRPTFLIYLLMRLFRIFTKA